MRWLVKWYKGVLERFCNIPGLNSIYFIFNDMIYLFFCSFISPNWLRVRGRKKKLISRILCSRQQTDTKTTRVYSTKSSRIFTFLFWNSQTEFVRLRLLSKGYGSPADSHDQYSCIINTSIHDVTHTHAVLWFSTGRIHVWKKMKQIYKEIKCLKNAITFLRVSMFPERLVK